MFGRGQHCSEPVDMVRAAFDADASGAQGAVTVRLPSTDANDCPTMALDQFGAQAFPLVEGVSSNNVGARARHNIKISVTFSVGFGISFQGSLPF